MYRAEIDADTGELLPPLIKLTTGPNMPIIDTATIMLLDQIFVNIQRLNL